MTKKEMEKKIKDLERELAYYKDPSYKKSVETNIQLTKAIWKKAGFFVRCP